jgi:hypothetical protein
MSCPRSHDGAVRVLVAEDHVLLAGRIAEGLRDGGLAVDAAHALGRPDAGRPHRLRRDRAGPGPAGGARRPGVPHARRGSARILMLAAAVGLLATL